MSSLTNFYESLIIGIVQGLTEFLPISSTAHINLLGSLLGSSISTQLIFETFLHFGSLFALIFFYRQNILSILKNFYVKNHPDQKLFLKLIVAFLPVVIIGGLFGSQLKAIFTEEIIPLSLIIGGIIMIIVNLFAKKNHHLSGNMYNLSFTQALTIGIAQTIAIIPGVSRSGATITTGVIAGLSPIQAFDFSFLLAIPTIFAANCYSLTKEINHFNSSLVVISLFGAFAAFIFSLLSFKLARKAFIKFKYTLACFGIYRIVLALFL
ncbi:undecaprenyl-diphosphate phosphatase [Rickettsiales endosymbiont of Stachyamoeba lipophora]|uniref:undecaprenyl-diphosphate phosphatase n=1 Tax=Rickettsiales endosymbiont of Stachyamoeba lipophora TaxID=2486578 RepID=UPI000F64AE73|nr:undecaprenyl-diphosphate phosphatase [Rickettsiales endosymbiont of Stachyamoeba lipophora]AZL15100.1 undecaprenyl-diphosphate phosphatase [Rickettsiales endosymbiont of Stachyamoeba lipophora]